MSITPIKKRIYFDYAATTPVDPAVLRIMEPYFSAKFGKFGNPGSLHGFGQEAIAAIDKSREIIGHAIGAEFREIIFTGSATEANNLALRGAVHHALKKSKTSKPRVVISAIEHESVFETARELEREGVEVVVVPVDVQGTIKLEKLREVLNSQTVIISIMYANNEIGTIQPIVAISRLIKDIAPQALFHTDAAQAFQFLDCDVNGMGVDLMTLSSHKIYGPKGAAALYIRGLPRSRKNGTTTYPIDPLIVGGGQEFGLRSGTENVPAIVGFAKAVELAAAARAKESKRVTGLRANLWHDIIQMDKKVSVNGVQPTGDSAKKAPEKTLPNILNVCFSGRAAQDLLTRFDLAGLAASSGSACRSRGLEPSYVIEALGKPREIAKSSIRFSLGRFTNPQEIRAALAIIKKACD